MASKIKVDNINKVSDDSNIINKCGTTITLGASGDSIALASGATQTGFGRTGTVDWNTTPVTATPTTATSGTGYFINSTGGAKTINLPASPSAGDIVSVKDYTGTAATYAITVGRNGSLIRSGTDDFVIEKNNGGATFVYVDGVEGWQIFVDGSDADVQASYIEASGGNQPTATGCIVDTNYKYHYFTSPGTFTITKLGDGTAGSSVDYMVIGGGGSGGIGNGGGGGGGAGGYRESKCSGVSGCWTASPLVSGSSLPVTASAYPITVGGGGAAKPASPSGSPGNQGNPGDDSTFSTITATGGGGGGGYGGSGPLPCATQSGLPGGSGGGGAKRGGPSPGGSGNTPPTSPPQGQDGGDVTTPTPVGGNVGAGGGGAGCQGETVSWPSNRGGNGGVGVTNTITGSPVGRAGGGGSNAETGDARGGTGGYHSTGGTPSPETPSPGSSPLVPGFGGGNGSSGNQCGQTGIGDGTANTGGGGGGADGPAPTINTGAGGSGIVIIRYRAS